MSPFILIDPVRADEVDRRREAQQAGRRREAQQAARRFPRSAR